VVKAAPAREQQVADLEREKDTMSKRQAGTELNKDKGSEEAGTWQKADEVRLA